MERIEEIVSGYVGEGIYITQELVDYLTWYCCRKMEAAKVENKKEYLPVLFEDEIRNYFIREATNATTMLGQLEKEGSVCVMCAK